MIKNIIEKITRIAQNVKYAWFWKDTLAENDYQFDSLLLSVFSVLIHKAVDFSVSVSMDLRGSRIVTDFIAWSNLIVLWKMVCGQKTF